MYIHIYIYIERERTNNYNILLHTYITLINLRVIWVGGRQDVVFGFPARAQRGESSTRGPL